VKQNLSTFKVISKGIQEIHQRLDLDVDRTALDGPQRNGVRECGLN